MIQVTPTVGKCILCTPSAPEKDGYDCKFADNSLVGFLCVRHFNHTAGLRRQPQNPQSALEHKGGEK